ncbi:ABC transporter substrate-binding protein [Gordoniibacillus kamchatkensis]|uniref:ABC transporter substrate-binding protein n=1 Tax=Gordoniibacillus kamchatkensis TaxID=1590651 RepID=UPI000A941065
MRKASILLAALLLVAIVASACGKKDEGAAAGSAASGSSAAAPATVKLGIFKNVTHAAGYVALQNGYFKKYWGDNVKIEVTAFDNGSDFSTALATGQIDLGYVGPGPATNQYLKSKNFRVVSGSANGGAVLAVRKDAGINSVKDLAGKTVAIPTKGSTNEISLRLLLQQEGLKVGQDKGRCKLSRALRPIRSLPSARKKWTRRSFRSRGARRWRRKASRRFSSTGTKSRRTTATIR